ncbi:MAG TPA: AAA family ATPase, partial [Chloroflexia bacterium]|nr:AAA family ATPase [Chloroflexia bacterium]
LDELEKAHPSVINLFLQVFDEGRLRDGHGRAVYFSDVTVVLTSNAGADHYSGRGIGFMTPRGEAEPPLPPAERPARRLSPESALAEARKHFPAELIARMDKVILFQPLSRETARQIVRQKLDVTLARIFGPPATPPVAVTYETAVVDYVVARGFSPEWGGRYVERAIEEQVLAPLARETFDPAWDTVRAVHISVGAAGLVFAHGAPVEDAR